MTDFSRERDEEEKAAYLRKYAVNDDTRDPIAEKAWQESGCAACVSRVNGAGCVDCRNGAARRIILLFITALEQAERLRDVEAAGKVLGPLLNEHDAFVLGITHHWDTASKHRHESAHHRADEAVREWRATLGGDE